jgi:hypothetical protein
MTTRNVNITIVPVKEARTHVEALPLGELVELIESAAAFIAAELRTLLDPSNSDSHINRRLQEACPAWDRLTNGERAFAAGRALIVVQRVSEDLSSLETDADDWFEDEEAA